MSTRYTMFKHKDIERLMDTFFKHTRYVNDKYERIKSKDNSCSSDRDRFVYHMFRKLIDKYIVILDRVVIAWHEKDEQQCISRIWICEPTSIFSSKFESYPAEPSYRYEKKFLHIRGFSAVNSLYGPEYIEMHCYDIFGNNLKLKIDHNNLLKLQFKEITKMEFDMVANVFADDRDKIPYEVKRFTKTETLNNRKKPKTVIAEETITVMAKDEVEARNSLTNVLSVIRVEN